MYEELAPKSLYPKLKKNIENFMLYFPDYLDTPNYVPPKKFMWDVFATIDYDMACKFVDHSMRIRANKQKDNKSVEIDIDPEIYREFITSDYLPKKKGRALNMMFSANINKRLKRKRKHKIDTFDPFKNFEGKRKKTNDSEIDEDEKIIQNQFVSLRKRTREGEMDHEDAKEQLRSVFEEEQL